jgi:hypothetical protein
MNSQQLHERARRARRHARVLRVITQEIHAQVQQTCPRFQRRQPERRVQRDRTCLRPLTPEANMWMIELTAEILVARGLDV